MHLRRPIAGLAIAYGAGVMLGDYLHASILLLIALASVLIAAAIYVPNLRRWFVLAAFTLVGWANMVWHTAVLSPNDLRSQTAVLPQLVTMRGSLINAPEVRVSTREGRTIERTLARLIVNQWKPLAGTNWVRAKGRIMVSTRGTLPEGNYFAGQEVEITGVLNLPPGPIAPGLFDYRGYLARLSIYHELRAESDDDWGAVSAGKASLSDRFIAWGNRVLAQGLPEEDVALNLIRAMALGTKSGVTPDVYESFMRSGTMHIFAISGLHIALIAAMLARILSLASLSRRWTALTVIPLLWFYTAATGWQPSAIRSTIMMTIVLGGWAINRPSDLLNSLAAAALLILAWDPQELFTASFQLSFFVVLSIAVMLPRLQEWRDRRLVYDPLLPPELAPWRTRLRVNSLRTIFTFVSVSLASMAGALPLTAYYFHVLSPITLFANIVIVPLSSLALASSLGAILCAPICPLLTDLFNHSAWLWMKLMVETSNASLKVPLACLNVQSPGPLVFVLYYLTIGAAAGGWLSNACHRIWVAVSLVACGMLWAGSTLMGLPEAKVTILPLEGGSSICVQPPGLQSSIVVDCGRSSTSDYITIPFLRSEGFNQLPWLILTHGDIRHTGGASLVTENFQVLRVGVSPIRFRSTVYRKFLDQCQASSRTSVTYLQRRSLVSAWSVLHPDEGDRFSTADDSTLVLHGFLNGVSVLLLSDLSPRGQAALLEREPNLRADIVVTGLPSSGFPLEPLLLETLQPRLIIVTDSNFPFQEKASPKVRERLSEKFQTVFTSDTGALTLRIRNQTWELARADGSIIALNQRHRPPGPSQERKAALPDQRRAAPGSLWELRTGGDLALAGSGGGSPREDRR